MRGDSVLWAEIPEDGDGEEAADYEAHGDVDDTFAARRLRRWLKGMFGGQPAAGGESGEPGGSPDENV
jgi:hypothetical protein